VKLVSFFRFEFGCCQRIPWLGPALNIVDSGLVKRRRALLESTSSRNSQLETHPKDVGRVGGPPIVRTDFLMPLKLIKRSCREAASLLSVDRGTRLPAFDNPALDAAAVHCRT
jgi:hypothetical protein